MNEKFYDYVADKNPLYTEGLVDTLCLHGEKYFFSRTPLAARKGYTNILPDDNEGITSTGAGPVHSKAYRVSWLVRNDSLFIDKIYPFYRFWYSTDENGLLLEESLWKPINIIPEDTILFRFESFTGNLFKNGLLFVDWINGDFGILKINPNAPEKKAESILRIKEADYIYPPLLLNVANGIVSEVKKDKKAIKRLKKLARSAEKSKNMDEKIKNMRPEKASKKREKLLEQTEKRQKRSFRKMEKKTDKLLR
ncbi:MAG: hypothetical protein LBQ60_12975 [Bacteroidales bacterium]|nr:hypothetical protein [Bacteroidales bacterium]